MSTVTNQSKKKTNVPGGMIVGFGMLFTPFFLIGIILIIGSFIMMQKKKLENEQIGGIGNTTKTNTTNMNNKNPLIRIKEKDAPTRHSRDREPIEKMSKEDRDNYLKYHSIKNTYEQTVTPTIIKKNTSNKCQVCRNVSTKNLTYCEVCGELFGDGLKCTFCKTKNELNAVYCKNCGVRFKK